MLFAHPDTRVHYVVTVPEKPGFAASEKPGFGEKTRFLAGLRHRNRAGELATARRRRHVYPFHRIPPSSILYSPFSIYIDPKQDEAARRWHSHVVDLSGYAGQAVTIIFETGTGPAGDERYDWAGWGAPRLLGRVPRIVETHD